MAEIHWVNPVDGNFDAASDWSGGAVPGRSDDAFIDAPGGTPYTVTLTAIQILNTLQIASTATLDVSDSTLAPLNGADNSGTIIIGEMSNFTPGITGVGGLINSGTLYAEDGGDFILDGVVNNSGEIIISSK